MKANGENKMKRICCQLFMFFAMSVLTLTCFGEEIGGILFTKAEFTRDGFEEYFGRSSTKKGWWELRKRNICIINPDGTGLKQLTDDSISYHAKWSPNGKLIAFLSGPTSMVSLNIMNRDGSNKRQILSNQENIYDFRWSPDGTKILVFLKTKMARNPDEAWVISINNSSDIQKMGSTEWAKGWNHWAPEGSTIVNPDRRLIKALPAGIEWPEWSPDGNYLAFVSDGRLYIVDAKRTGMLEPWKPTKTEPPCDKIGSWSWSSKSDKLLFLVSGNVCSIEVGGKNIIENTMSLSMSHSEGACWSPDGLKVAFIAYDGRKRNSEIFIMNADGTDQKQLTNTNYFHEEIDWK